MQRHSAHFSPSSSPFWGALLFQQSQGWDFPPKLFCHGHFDFCIIYLLLQKENMIFIFFCLGPSVDPRSTTASWRSRTAGPGTTRGFLRGMPEPQKVFFPRFPGLHVAEPHDLSCSQLSSTGALSSLFISANTYRILMSVQWVACTWLGVCCSHNEACIEPGATEARSQRMLLSPL